MTEEEHPKTGVPAKSAKLFCKLCKSDAFHVLLDVSHKHLMAGERYTADRTDRFGAIECVACGELYNTDFMGALTP